MKIIKYNLKSTRTLDGETEEYMGAECILPYSEANLAIARAEAWEEPTIEDDGQPELVPSHTDAERIQILEANNKELSSKLEASIQANANLEDCLVELAEIVYA